VRMAAGRVRRSGVRRARRRARQPGREWWRRARRLGWEWYRWRLEPQQRRPQRRRPQLRPPGKPRHPPETTGPGLTRAGECRRRGIAAEQLVPLELLHSRQLGGWGRRDMVAEPAVQPQQGEENLPHADIRPGLVGQLIIGEEYIGENGDGGSNVWQRGVEHALWDCTDSDEGEAVTTRLVHVTSLARVQREVWLRGKPRRASRVVECVTRPLTRCRLAYGEQGCGMSALSRQ
jgi:hypothetical protein